MPAEIPAPKLPPDIQPGRTPEEYPQPPYTEPEVEPEEPNKNPDIPSHPEPPEVEPEQPPKPETYFGHKPGADRTLIPWSKVVGWFGELDKASDRVVVQEYGKSTEGRPMIAAFISAPQNLQRMEALIQS